MRSLLALSIACSVLASAPCLAQQPPPAPAPAPAPYGWPVTLDQARAVAAAAEAEARKNNWSMTIAIVDPSGNLVHLAKMDGASNGSLGASQAKARSAALFRGPTKAYEDRLAAGQTYLLTLPGVIPIEGGVPIVADGRQIGAIGVSGGSAQQDGQVSRAGAAAIK